MSEHTGDFPNAHLVAAAPELFEALRVIVNAWFSIPENIQVPDEINIDDYWEAAKRALAKAEGREP